MTALEETIAKYKKEMLAYQQRAIVSQATPSQAGAAGAGTAQAGVPQAAGSTQPAGLPTGNGAAEKAEKARIPGHTAKDGAGKKQKTEHNKNTQQPVPEAGDAMTDMKADMLANVGTPTADIPASPAEPVREIATPCLSLPENDEADRRADELGADISVISGERFAEEPEPAASISANGAFSLHTGLLRVHVTMARMGMPLSGVTVEIRSPKQLGGVPLHTFVTDAHGLIQPVSLPAADREESLAPGTPHPYKQYQVECHAPGYYRVIHAHVSVFEGVTTTQTVNMIPLPEGMERGNMVFEQTGEADL